jgi:hypothetical protein
LKGLQNKVILVEISLTTSYYQDLITALYDSEIDFAIEDYTDYLFSENREMSRIWIDPKDQLIAKHLLKKVSQHDNKYPHPEYIKISRYILVLGVILFLVFYALSYFGVI